ncbi:MAG: tetratricopeptide (TPR) repeat protein [Psychroserpens sp.]|jgi:tetratricopeptide (TPR) repeat protein
MRKIIALVFLGAIGFTSCDTQPEPKKVVVEPLQAEPVVLEMVRLDSLTKLLDANPGDAKLLHERAKVFLEVDEINFALADVGRALLVDSTVAEYYLTISDVYFRMNEPVKCKNALLKATAMQPEYREPLHRLAQFELYLGNHQKSINYANEMLRLDARDDRPFVIKALCFKELGDTAKAVQNYLEAVTENPDNYDAYVELGVLHWGMGNPLAEAYLKSALDIRPEGVDALYALGMQYQQTDKLNEALETYTRILEIDSTYRSAYFNMGYIQYQYLQLYNEALINFDKAVKVDSEYYQAVYMRGLCYEAKGDVSSAKREYAYSLQLNPDYGKAADGMTRLLAKNSN